MLASINALARHSREGGNFILNNSMAVYNEMPDSASGRTGCGHDDVVVVFFTERVYFYNTYRTINMFVTFFVF